jgi:diadenosine tetraphosphate (Ap4A) HIT family hydrolase
LCEADGGALLVRRPRWRLIRAEEPGFPAFYRVIWNEHVREFSELSAPERAECMDAVVTVESLLREHLQPTKVNIAALGNAVPHLHWHVIARFDWDSHFPGSVWAASQREAPAEPLRQVLQLRAALEQALAQRLG